MLEDYCITRINDPHSLIFFKKLQADIYRYMNDMAHQEGFEGPDRDETKK